MRWKGLVDTDSGNGGGDVTGKPPGIESVEEVWPSFLRKGLRVSSATGGTGGEVTGGEAIDADLALGEAIGEAGVSSAAG
jgi:hypothetical protein